MELLAVVHHPPAHRNTSAVLYAASCVSIVITATSPPSHAAFHWRASLLAPLAIPMNAQPRAISRSFVIRTRAAFALSSSDIVVAHPARASPINHAKAIFLVLISSSPRAGPRHLVFDRGRVAQGRHAQPPARFTLTRSWAPHTRISVTVGCLISRTRTLAFLPPTVVKGRPVTSHSLVSSVMRSPMWSSMGRTRDVPGSVERGPLIGCCCNGSSAFRREGILAGGFLSVASSPDSSVLERLRGLEARRCLVIRISLHERLPRRLLHCVRTFPASTRCARGSVFHPGRVKRGQPALFVIPGELKIIVVVNHAHRDSSDPAKGSCLLGPSYA